MKLQEHTDISPWTLAVFAAGHPWWWHMSNIYKYNLNSTLHISSDSLQIKVYYSPKRQFCKSYGKLYTISFIWTGWRLHPSHKEQLHSGGDSQSYPLVNMMNYVILKSKSARVFLRILIHVSSWRCLTLWGPGYAPKYMSMGSCKNEPVKTGKQDPQLLITEWWKPDSKETCYSDPKCRILSVKTNNKH